MALTCQTDSRIAGTFADVGADTEICYDPSNTDGVVWGEVSILVKAEVEASP